MGADDLELKILLLCGGADGAYAAEIYRILNPDIITKANPGPPNPGLGKVSAVLHDLESLKLCSQKFVKCKGKGNTQNVFTVTDEGWQRAEERFDALTKLFQQAAKFRRKKNES